MNRNTTFNSPFLLGFEHLERRRELGLQKAEHVRLVIGNQDGRPIAQASAFDRAHRRLHWGERREQLRAPIQIH